MILRLIELFGGIENCIETNKFAFVSEHILMKYFLQTSFVDCLIEQTHPEIYSSDDKDVSINY